MNNPIIIPNSTLYTSYTSNTPRDTRRIYAPNYRIESTSWIYELNTRLQVPVAWFDSDRMDIDSNAEKTIEECLIHLETIHTNIEIETKECSVCLSGVTSDACKVKICHHVFHKACILPWISKNDSCPNCRASLR